ncbi:hypothetical protein [Niastella populi]|uniref:Uncharacterized protein n=1 Tax=Niastella populi TaxID=550983 RepID=A0A1V9EJA3_9BACT|nr:hypothetical protein [Niastella populi]OQP46206.1 hypothetical protein A4R26_32160 [Niastella populi]
MRFLVHLVIIAFFLPAVVNGQQIEKVVFNAKDSTSGYYLAVRPQAQEIKGVVILVRSFRGPESLLSETKLHNVAFANNILTVMASMNQKVYADTVAVNRLSLIIRDIITRFSADTSKFVLAGYDYAGNIVLRYTELTYEQPSQFPVQPKAVFTIDSPVDLFGVWHWCERQIKKNYYPPSVGDAKFILDLMTKENGSITAQPGNYKRLTPFYKDAESAGNEQYLKNVAVRLYFDTDVEWQLKNRRNSLYDTNIPDGSELINRLLLAGNTNAEFIQAKQPGMRSNGVRNPSALSIVDEVDCIHWIKRKLDIFDPVTWVPPYNLPIPKGWGVERYAFPIDFAPAISHKGVGDLRFMPGWGDSASEEYWSYAFLWWLKGEPELNANVFKENLKTYYDGLVAGNVTRRKIPAGKVVPVTVTVKAVKPDQDDKETFSGTVNMLDYMAQQPITLNVRIHVRDCKLHNRTVIFFEVSPKPFSHKVWSGMRKVYDNFECTQ